jgi:hypothetical protein
MNKEELRDNIREMVEYLLPDDAQEKDIIYSYTDTFTLIAEKYHESQIKKEKMYLVQYSEGLFEDVETVDVFVTNNRSKASEYVMKFNRILNEYKEYYDTKDGCFSRTAPISECWFDEIEVR